MKLNIILRVPEEAFAQNEAGKDQLQSSGYETRITTDSHTGQKANLLEVVMTHSTPTLEQSLEQASRFLQTARSVYATNADASFETHSYWTLIVQFPKMEHLKRLLHLNRKFEPHNFHGPHQKFEPREDFDILRIKERTLEALLDRLAALTENAT
jgi:hypothetical protein